MCSDKEAVQETKSVASGRPCQKISTYWWAGGLALSAAFCTAVMTPLLHMRVYEPLAAVVLALLVAVLAVRALGQTDLNPVSGVGKLSQVCSGRMKGAILSLQPCTQLRQAWTPKRVPGIVLGYAALT